MNKEQTDAEFIEAIKLIGLKCGDDYVDEIVPFNVTGNQLQRLAHLAHKGVKAEKLKEALQDLLDHTAFESNFGKSWSRYQVDDDSIKDARAALKDFNDE